MAHDSILNLTEDAFDTVVENSDVPVLVDFWAQWCGPCKMLSPILDQLAEEVGDSAKICKVDVDSNKALAAKFQVTSIPLILFFKGGEKVDEIRGMTSKDVLAAKLQELA